MIQIVRIILGFVLWSGFFLLIYGAQATGCAIGMDPARLRLVLIAALGLGVVAGVWPIVLARRHASPLSNSALLASCAALGATVLVFSGVLWMKLC